MSYTNIGRIIFTIEALDYTRQTFTQVTNAIQNLGDTLQNIMSTMIDWSRQIMSVFSSVVQSVWNLISSVVNAIASIADSIGGFGVGSIVGAIMSVIGAMIQMELTAKEISVKIFGMLGETVLAGLQAVTQGVMDTINAIFQLGSQGWNSIAMLTLGLAAFGEQFAQLTAGFEAAFGEITALIKGFGMIMREDMTGEIERLREYIYKFGMESVFSVSEITDAMSKFIKMGIEPTVAGFEDAVDAIIKMAYLGQTNIEDSISYISTVMYGFGLTVEDVVKITDALTGAAIISVAELSDLGYSLSYTSATAHMLGLSMEEALIYVTSMVDVLGSARMGMAGRYFRSLLQDISDPKTHKRLQRMSAILGESITFFDEASGEAKDFGEWIQTIGKYTRQMSDVEFKKFCQALGLTIQSSEALNILLQTTPERLAEITAAVQQDGLNQKLYADRIQNVADAFKILQNMLETLWLVFSGRFVPALRDFITWLRDFVEESGFKEWVESLGDLVNERLIGFFEKLRETIERITTGDLGKQLSEAFGKITDVGLDVILRFLDALTNWVISDDFQTFLDFVGGLVKGFLPALAEAVKKTFGLVGKFLGEVGDDAAAIGERLGEWLGKMMGFAMSLTAMLMPLSNFITVIFTPLMPILEAVIDNLDYIGKKIGPIIGDFADLFFKILLGEEATKNWGDAVKKLVDELVVPTLEKVRDIMIMLTANDRLKKLIDAMIIFAGAFTATFVNILTDVAESITKLLNTLNDPQSELAKQIALLGSFFANVIPKLFVFSIKMVDAMFRGCFGKSLREFYIGEAPEISGTWGKYTPAWLTPQQRAEAMRTGVVPGDWWGKWQEHLMSAEEKVTWTKWMRAGEEFDSFLRWLDSCAATAQGIAPTGPVGGGCLGCTGIVPAGLQRGGIALGPTLAMLAERGRPEAVVPLDEFPSFGTMMANITIYTGPVSSNVDMERAVEDAMDRWADKVRLRGRRYIA